MSMSASGHDSSNVSRSRNEFHLSASYWSTSERPHPVTTWQRVAVSEIVICDWSQWRLEAAFGFNVVA